MRDMAITLSRARLGAGVFWVINAKPGVFSNIKDIILSMIIKYIYTIDNNNHK